MLATAADAFDYFPAADLMMLDAREMRVAGTSGGFCRKDFTWQESSLPWTQLCCEGRELLECRDACLC